MDAAYDKEISNWVDYGYPSYMYNPSRLCDFLYTGTYVMNGLPDSD